MCLIFLNISMTVQKSRRLQGTSVLVKVKLFNGAMCQSLYHCLINISLTGVIFLQSLIRSGDQDLYASIHHYALLRSPNAIQAHTRHWIRGSRVQTRPGSIDFFEA